MHLSSVFDSQHPLFCSTQTLAVYRVKVIISIRERRTLFQLSRSRMECQKRVNTTSCYRLFNGQPDHFCVALQQSSRKTAVNHGILIFVIKDKILFRVSRRSLHIAYYGTLSFSISLQNIHFCSARWYSQPHKRREKK